MMLGSAIGLGAAEPATADNPVAGFGLGAALVWTVSALISLFAGGWVAGRYAARQNRVTGCVHGFLVWCLATVIGIFLVAGGAGALVGGATQIVGAGLSSAGKASGGLADLAKQAVEQTTGATTSMVDEVTERVRTRGNGSGVAAAQREVGQALRAFFREGGNPRDPQARAALAQALQKSGGMTQEEANQTIDGWVASMEQLKAQLAQAKQEAEAKAREAADKAAAGMAKAALWAFIGFVLGAAAASWGGITGARTEYRHMPMRDPLAGSHGHGALPGHA